ncbi:MAG: hypothetical protein Q8K93_02325 [Reyranella sp.]|nr:hypothetical protein [Reyranella sp.]
MNEPNEDGAETPGAVIYQLPEIRFTPDGQHSVEPSDDVGLPVAAPPAQVPPQEPHAEAPAPAEPAAEESPAEEPPIERHDPFAWMRNAPWMNRRLSPSGRAAYLLRRDLEAFPIIEGRDPNYADLDAIVKRTVDYIVPILRREQATDIVYEELEKRRAERIAKARAAALALPAAREATKATARGAASLLAAMPAGALAPAVAAAVALKPKTPDDGTFDLGEELRLRTPSGSLEGEIERRVGDRWETIGIRAALNAGLGAKVLLDDVAGFANAVGAGVAGRLADRGVVGGRPVSAGTGEALRSAISWKASADLAALDALGPDSARLPVAEMRYLASEKGVVRFGDIEKEDVGRLCPSYLRIQKIGIEAGDIVRERGLVRALDFGQQMHRLAELRIKKATELLEKEGIHKIHAEFALLDGKEIKYVLKGTDKLDVIEFRDKGRTVCIYDFKTGRAPFRDTDMKRYGKAGADYAYKTFGVLHPNVYVFPIFVPGLDGIQRQP